MIKKIVSTMLLLCLLFSLFACKAEKAEEGKELYTATRLDLFDTVTVIKGYESSKAEFDKTVSEIYPVLEKYHKLLDIYYEYADISNVRTVNLNAGKETKVSAELFEFLEYAKEVYYLTDGKTNAALGSVLSIWHNYREEGTALPEGYELQEASKHTDIDKLVLDKEKMSVTLLDEKMSLDVGALAKGYVAEKVVELLEDRQKEGYIVSLGGNVFSVGLKPDKEMWSVGIENPKLDGSYICKLKIGEASLVTSGDYQRFYTVNGKSYNHIIDVETLYPAEYFTLVSVLTPDAALADALSTALFCMSVEEGKALLSELENTYALWLCKDGKIIYSEGMEQFIE